MQTTQSLEHRRLMQAIAGLSSDVSPTMVAEVEALYRPLHLAQRTDDVQVEQDAAYGPHPRHRLDVFLPRSSRPTAAVIFVHGGAFLRGDKAKPGSTLYGNVGRWLARQGLVGIAMTYRLAPEFTWPSGAEDVAAAVDWATAQASRWGIAFRRVHLFGHSAGAVHVASYLGAERFAATAREQVAGAVLLSGVYDLTTAPPHLVEPAYFGSDARMYVEMSTLHALTQTPVPLMLGVAQLDPPAFAQQAANLYQALVAAGRRPAFLVATGHNHISEVAHLDAVESPLSRQLSEFFAASEAASAGAAR